MHHVHNDNVPSCESLIQMVAVEVLTIRPGAVEVVDMVYVKHSSSVSVTLSDSIDMGIHWTLFVSVMSKSPLTDV